MEHKLYKRRFPNELTIKFTSGGIVLSFLSRLPLSAPSWLRFNASAAALIESVSFESGTVMSSWLLCDADVGGGPFRASISETATYPGGIFSPFVSWSTCCGEPIFACPLELFWTARICKRARNGARQIGQLLAWYRNESAHELHKHKCRHGRISVSRVSLMQITHSLELSSLSSSIFVCEKSKMGSFHCIF